MKYRYKLIVSYDGTNYHGWQTQKNSNTVQETLEKILEKICQTKTSLVSSSRTDAGTHAIEHVSHFDSSIKINEKRLLFSLNSLLPKDIRILEIAPAPFDFHSRYGTKRKIYHYHIYIADKPSPFNRLYCYHFRKKIDVPLLKKAAKILIGKHNFTSFSNKATEGAAKNNPIKHLFRLDVLSFDEEIRLEFEADGFLYKMVRNITGTLLEIATGKIPIENLPSILYAKDRRKAGKTAPAKGLFLIKTIY